jgi:hypothetical protein
MAEIRVVPDLWATSILPEGILQAWLCPDGAQVAAGEAIARVLIEDALHDLVAPAAGRLRRDRQANACIEPGALIGHVEPSAGGAVTE